MLQSRQLSKNWINALNVPDQSKRSTRKPRDARQPTSRPADMLLIIAAQYCPFVDIDAFFYRLDYLLTKGGDRRQVPQWTIDRFSQ